MLLTNLLCMTRILWIVIFCYTINIILCVRISFVFLVAIHHVYPYMPKMSKIDSEVSKSC